MLWFLDNVRRIVYACAFLTGALMFAIVSHTNPSERVPLELTRSFAFAAVAFIYLALLASPLAVVFPQYPLRIFHIKARKALGVSGYFFALIH